MLITIKVLKGEECEVEVMANRMSSFKTIKNTSFFLQVTDTTTVFELKQRIEKALRIPVAHQKLLCTGRTLVDDKTISSYGPAIKNGTKLTLVVKEPEPLRDIIAKVLKRHYTDSQADEMAKEIIENFEKRMHQLSLDDLERMATFYLERDNLNNCVGGSDSAATTTTTT